MLRQTLRQLSFATARWAAPRLTPRLLVARRLRGFCRSHLSLGKFTVVVTARSSGSEFHVVRIVRSGERIEISCLEWALINRHRVFNRLVGPLTPIALAPTQHVEAVAEVSDGENSGPGIISFCSRDPRAILVPDDGFIITRGYENLRKLAQANLTPWGKRIDRIIWRGSDTGSGVVSKPDMVAHDAELLPRVRLCLELRGVPGTDVKISNVLRADGLAVNRGRLANAGILGDFISPRTWCGCKFAIDIDGNSNAWSNFFTRLLMGCCILKIASPTGYRQWYYDEIEPWTHFIPVAADLSDLHERVAWARANLDQCARIAANGQAFAMTRTFETETARSARHVYEAQKDGTLRNEL